MRHALPLESYLCRSIGPPSLRKASDVAAAQIMSPSGCLRPPTEVPSAVQADHQPAAPPQVGLEPILKDAARCTSVSFADFGPTSEETPHAR